MKRTCLAALAALIAATASASFDALTLEDGIEVAAPFAAKAVRARLDSSVASGTAAVKAVSSMPVYTDVSTVLYATNWTYTVIYTNGAETVTNVTDYVPLPLGPNVTSYATNSVVTVLGTNVASVATSYVTKTNSLVSLTASGGTATNDVTNGWIFPGDVLFFEGTAKGRVMLIIEK